jgi:hypothetical protein
VTDRSEPSLSVASPAPDAALECPAAPMQRGGRKLLPMGRGSGPHLLRAPSYWPVGKPWPPSVTKAKGALVGARNRMRSAFSLFTYAGALAKRGLDKGRGGEADLVEAFSIFDQIAASGNTKHFAKYRAIALFNATTCMNALPHRAANQIAGSLALRAVEAIGDALLGDARQALSPLIDRLVRPSAMEPLRWGKEHRLLPGRPSAKEAIARVTRPIEGSWRGIRSVLLSSGLLAPDDCTLRDPVLLAVPQMHAIEVRAS